MAVRETTPVGREIRKKLADMDMTIKDYCEPKGITPSIFYAMLRSNELHRRLLKETCEDLGIKM